MPAIEIPPTLYQKQRRFIDPEERFWAKVQRRENSCWEWVACLSEGGYGDFQLNGKRVSAHRYAWEIVHNRKAPSELHVGHLCNNPKCVSPFHLRLGTPDDNRKHCVKCGRTAGPFRKYRVYARRPRETAMDRFLEKIDRNGPIHPYHPELGNCHEWIGCRNPDGYGMMGLGKTNVLCTKFIWIQTTGPIPPGLIVLHSCDNPACVNLLHLSVGTYKRNAEERVKRGRSNPPIGERQHLAKLTASQVVEIRRLHAAGGFTYSKLANQFGVSIPTMRDVIKRRTWKHVD